MGSYILQCILQAGISQAYISYRHVSLASVHLTVVHLKGRRTFIPIEQTTQPAGVLCSMGWGDQVPLNGSASTPQPSFCLGAISPQFVPPDTSRRTADIHNNIVELAQGTKKPELPLNPFC